MISTKKLANDLEIKPASIIHRVCTHGSYFGIKPTKLRNGRLAWPENAFELLKNHSSELDTLNINSVV